MARLSRVLTANGSTHGSTKHSRSLLGTAALGACVPVPARVPAIMVAGWYCVRRLMYEQYAVPFPAPGAPPPLTVTFQRKSANRRVVNEAEMVAMLRQFGEVGAPLAAGGAVHAGGAHAAHASTHLLAAALGSTC
jgi:hypothetical protein